MADDLPQEFGPYTLQELIGRGGMAEIYRASMPGIGGFEKTVAIKKILPHLAEDEEFTSMLIDEARIIESLDHSNIAQVFDLGRRDGTYYIAMEYIHGVDLADAVKDLQRRGTALPIPHVLHITSSICAGLHFAHSKTDEEGNPLNIIHRDISPHNIRLSFAGEVKIIDFGVAKAADRESQTEMGVIKGKLLYMAPEQAKAEDLDGRADLFATGLCAYKMLTGTLPFDGDNEFQIYNNILQKEIAPPQQLRPKVPDDLNRIVMKLLRRDPDERYQEGYSAKQDLDELLHEIAPGYTVNRLARFVEENFSHLVQTDADASAADTSKNSDMVPATPSRPAPGTGQRDAHDLGPSGPKRADAGDPVRENVAAEGAGSETDHATPGGRSLPERDEPPAGGEPSPPDQQTETSDGETSSYGTGEPTDGGISGVFYAIAALLVAIAGMIAWAAFSEQDADPPSDPSPTPKADDDSAEEESERPTMVNISLKSEPSGATLLRDGRPIGETPYAFELPRRDEPIEVRLSKPGFPDRTVRVTPNEDLDRTIRLPAGDAGIDGDGDGGDAPVAGGSDDPKGESAGEGRDRVAETSEPESSGSS